MVFLRPSLLLPLSKVHQHVFQLVDAASLLDGLLGRLRLHLLLHAADNLNIFRLHLPDDCVLADLVLAELSTSVMMPCCCKDWEKSKARGSSWCGDISSSTIT